MLWLQVSLFFLQQCRWVLSLRCWNLIFLMKSKTCWHERVLRPHYCLIFQLLYSQWITRHSQQAHHHWHVSRIISSSWSRALVYLITRFAKFITILTVEQIRSSHWILVVADMGQALTSLVQFTFLSGP